MRNIFRNLLVTFIIWISLGGGAPPPAAALREQTSEHPLSAYPLAEPYLTGTWIGLDHSQVGIYTFSMQLIQAGEAFNGTHAWSNGPTGIVTGTISAGSVNWIRHDTATLYYAYFSGTFSNHYQVMSGTWLDNVGYSEIGRAHV